ncbi:MAG: aminoacyl--tRNA ligase-related protein [Patescibacteria group bacterium]
MKQSIFFTKTAKHSPEGEETANAKFLTRGGFIAKSSAGVYTFLPLGLRVLDKINKIIREEMNAIGGEELLMPSLIEKKYWQKSDRWKTEVVYRTGRGLEDGKAHDFEYGLGWTHEEVIAHIATNYIQSYRDLPKAVYQIQTKFRAEARAQGGILRGREFLMKDLYSFHVDHEDLNRYYETVKRAYKKIFKRLSLKALVVAASGGAFTKEFTHEFQVLNPAGEDTVHYCNSCGFAENKEIFDSSRHQCGASLEVGRSIEVGNIFRLGTKFSEAFGLSYRDEAGATRPVVMGSYGIGPSRVMGTIVEEYHDAKGIIWPEAVAPFDAYLLILPSESGSVQKLGEKIYDQLQKKNIQVLYDDRIGVSAGEKFADADLIGIPHRLLISDRTKGKIEMKERGRDAIKLVTANSVLGAITGKRK